MNTTTSPHCSFASQAKIHALQTRYFLASLNFVFVIAMAALFYFGVVARPGATIDGMTDSILSSLIVIVSAIGMLSAGGAWLCSLVQLQGLRRDNALVLALGGNS